MGCDIHAHMEIKVGGKWYHYSQPNIQRNYPLFTKMAGVRNYNHEETIEQISELRGLPENTTFTTKYDCDEIWGTDGHSHSWLNADEIQEIILFHEKQYEKKDFWKPQLEQWGYLFGSTFNGFIKYPEDSPKGLEDVRMVFWFDN